MTHAGRTSLGTAADLLVGFAFKSDGFLNEEDEGIPILRGENISQGSLKWAGKTKRWRSDDLPELTRYELQQGDVILAMDRPIVGDGLKFAWISETDLPCLLVQRVCRIRGKADTALTDFLRYVIASPAFSEHIHRITTGANIPHISGKDIAAFSFHLPDMAEQEKIVEALAPFDELAKNYERQTSLLEKAARLIYTEWFIRLQIPQAVISSITEKSVDGFVSDFVNVLSGGTPNTKVAMYWEGDIPFFTPADAPAAYYVVDTEKNLSEAGLTSCNSALFPKDTVFVTARGTVGKLALAQKPMAMNQSCYALQTKDGSSQFFLYCAMQAIVAHLKQAASGGVFDAIVVDTFRRTPMIWPPREVINRFHAVVEPIFTQIETLLLQIDQLRQARDLLLPRLISGQLRL